MWEVDFCECGTRFGNDWTEKYATEEEMYKGIESIENVTDASVRQVRMPDGSLWDHKRKCKKMKTASRSSSYLRY